MINTGKCCGCGKDTRSDPLVMVLKLSYITLTPGELCDSDEQTQSLTRYISICMDCVPAFVADAIADRLKNTSN